MLDAFSLQRIVLALLERRSHGELWRWRDVESSLPGASEACAGTVRRIFISLDRLQPCECEVIVVIIKKKHVFSTVALWWGSGVFSKDDGR